VIDKGQINFDFELIQWAFGNLQTVFFTWVIIFYLVQNSKILI